MILKSDYSTIVIVGIWNKGIFNLEWVSKFLLPKEKKLNVEFLLNTKDSSFDGSPRISSNKIRIFVIGNKLNFVPLNTHNETFELIQELTMKIADYLPHTPVTALGVNFLFENDISDSLIQILNINDTEKLIEFGASIKNTQHKHSMNIEGRSINLSISSNNSKIKFDFNFHFDISNLIELKEKINSNGILELKKIALNVMKDVYNLELNK